MVEKVSSGVGATPNNPSSQSAAQRVQTIAGASAEDVATFFSEEEWIELLSSYPDFYDLVAEALGADDPIGLVGADLDDSEEWEPLRAARERTRRRIVMQNRTDGTLH